MMSGRGQGRGLRAGVAAIAAFVILCGCGQVSSPVASATGTTIDDAARVLDVRPPAVVPTQDGYVAARRTQEGVELAIARASGGSLDSLVLATMVEPPGFAGSAVVEVSCDKSFGLTQPNFILGDSHEADRPPATLTLTGLQGVGSEYGHGPWVVVTADADVHGRPWELQADRGGQYQVEVVSGGSFRDPAACGTRIDLTEGSAPTTAPSPGTSRLLIDTSTVIEAGVSAGFGHLTVRTVGGSTLLDVDVANPSSWAIDTTPGEVDIGATSPLNACQARVDVKVGDTSVDVDWFAGGCRIEAVPVASP